MSKKIEFKVIVNYSPEDIDKLKERMATFIADLVYKDLTQEQLNLLIKKLEES